MEFTVGSDETVNASKTTGGERTIRPLYYVPR